MIDIIFTHTPTGGTQKFSRAHDARMFVKTCRTTVGKQKDMLNDITITYGGVKISMDIFEEVVPIEATELILGLELAYQRSVPKWHFIVPSKPKHYSTGRTYHMRRTLEVTHIAITMGYDRKNLRSIICHEYAHAVTVGESHGYEFYKVLFVIFKSFLSTEEEKRGLDIEFSYKKKSKSWYSWIYDPSVQARYYTAIAASPKPTPIADLFVLKEE